MLPGIYLLLRNSLPKVIPAVETSYLLLGNCLLLLSYLHLLKSKDLRQTLVEINAKCNNCFHRRRQVCLSEYIFFSFINFYSCNIFKNFDFLKYIHIFSHFYYYFFKFTFLLILPDTGFVGSTKSA